MKSDGVTKLWEFYRDNCAGFKEPMRKELRKLDDYVASIEDENAKLRELVRELYEDQCDECDEWKYRDRMCELGIEVDA